MRYRNRALGALIAVGMLASGAAAQQHGAGVPSVPTPGDAIPPPDLPVAKGPSGTSNDAAAARYDRVGYAAIDAGLHGVSAASGALPAGAYAEVTALDSGKIVLTRVAIGAPPAGRLAALSPDAARLLGVAAAKPAAIRIREVAPQAADEAALTRGQPAAPRLDAPPILLNGLRARLAAVATPPAAAAAPPPPAAAKAPAAAKPVPAPAPKPMAAPAKAPPVKAAPAKPAAATGRYRVQVATFSSQANAKTLAARIDGHVVPAGRYWRVELGPFADAATAQRARDGAAKRGYGDARVRKD
ncbi:MAG TPA: SPOR domain-containing protein [Sphingomonas sp.]|nr:SPOR domain-containing protein [Sphingomonas sp.]